MLLFSGCLLLNVALYATPPLWVYAPLLRHYICCARAFKARALFIHIRHYRWNSSSARALRYRNDASNIQHAMPCQVRCAYRRVRVKVQNAGAAAWQAYAFRLFSLFGQARRVYMRQRKAHGIVVQTSWQAGSGRAGKQCSAVACNGGISNASNVV